MLRRFWTFAAVVLAASLAGSQFAWPQLAAEGWAQRYWFIPALAFVTTLGWMACRGNQLAKVVGCGLLFLMLAALPVTWRYPARVDYDFPAQVARFENAPAGSPVQFRFNPVGWTMCLSKRQ